MTGTHTECSRGKQEMQPQEYQSGPAIELRPSPEWSLHFLRFPDPSTNTVNTAPQDGSSAERNRSHASVQEDIDAKARVVKAHLQLASLCWTMLLAGWNDASNGPLIPRIQSAYHVNFIVTSLIFISSALGFVSGALMNVWVSHHVAFGKLMVSGSVLQMIAYTLLAPGLPFPVFVMSYFVNGVGIAVQHAGCNGYVAALENQTKMGILHASYGCGAFVAPLIATQFARMTGWNLYYLCSLGIATINTVILSAVFRMKSQDECRANIGLGALEKGDSRHGAFRQIFVLKALHVLAFFIFVYTGTEVTIGGWIVTYMLQERDGGPNSGYIAAGFWGGIAVGRVALIWVTKKIGERRAIYLYTILGIGLEVIVWLVPSLIGGSVAVALVGLLLGPMYPIVMIISSEVLPRWLLTSCVGWIGGFGQAGSAALPFMTGVMANSLGIRSLQPLILGMMGALLAVWTIVPRRRTID